MSVDAAAYQVMSGVDRVATLLLALPDDRANDLLGRFSFDEIQQISYAMIKLKKISPDTVEKILCDFMENMHAVQPLKGSWERAEKLLAQILPEDKMSILKSRTQNGQTLWQDISTLSVGFFAEHLKKESNQTIAIILKHIPDKAYVVKILAEFPKETSVDLVYRMVNMPDVDHSVLHNLEQSLLSMVSNKTHNDSFSEMADLLDAMPPSQGNLLMEGLNDLHAPTAGRVRSFMFSFDEIAQLDNEAIQILMKSFNKSRLAMALKNVQPEMMSRFMSNMSARAGKLFQDEMSVLNNVTAEDIELAQVELAQLAKQLVKSGAIKRSAFKAPNENSEESEDVEKSSKEVGGGN